MCLKFPVCLVYLLPVFCVLIKHKRNVGQTNTFNLIRTVSLLTLIYLEIRFFNFFFIKYPRLTLKCKNVINLAFNKNKI